MSNEFTQTWFDTFLATRDRPSTEAEVALLRHVLPLPRYRRVLDVGAGIGRHAIPLAQAGHEVTALDRDERALARLARDAGDTVRCLPFDMRALHAVSDTFDAVICMWKSFGWFSDEENEALLDQMAKHVDAGGRIVLDLLNHAFLEAGRWDAERAIAGGRARERAVYDGRSFEAVVTYEATGETESFWWRIYSRDELDTLAARLGLKPMLWCARNDPTRAPTPSDPEVQVVYERA